MMLAFLTTYDRLIFTTLAFICVALGVLYSDQLISYFHNYFAIYIMATSGILTAIVLRDIFLVIFYTVIKGIL